LKPATCELAESPGNNDFIAPNDISFQTTGSIVWATLVTIAVEIDPVAGRALDLRQPVGLALAWKEAVPTNVVGVALELGGRGRCQERAPCEESERSLYKTSHWVIFHVKYGREIMRWLHSSLARRNRRVSIDWIEASTSPHAPVGRDLPRARPKPYR